MRVQHEAELKRLRAEANAKVREAQLKGMAQTAAAARAQAGTLFSRRTDDGKDGAQGGQTPAAAAGLARCRTGECPASRDACGRDQ